MPKIPQHTPATTSPRAGEYINVPTLVNNMNNTIIIFAATVRVLMRNKNNLKRVNVILIRDGSVLFRFLRVFTKNNLIHKSLTGVDNARLE